MRAMILSAGYGTRLWPLTEDRTKPALPILGKPLVGYVAEYLATFGCHEILVNLHHRPESVRAALGDGGRFGVTLTYVEEPTILGTSGALDNARQLLDRETFVVINGKIITDIDLNAALETHRQTKALATLVLLPNFARERFSIVECEAGLVKGFGGMPESEGSGKQEQEQEQGQEQGQEARELDRPQDADFGHEEGAPLMFTGIQILEPRIFEYIPRGVFSHSTTDVYPQAIANGERIAAHVGAGKWHELSTIQRYLEVSLSLLAEQMVKTGLGSQVLGVNQTNPAPDPRHPSPDTVFPGARCNIAAGARVDHSILWDDVTIDDGAIVERAVIGDGVHIRAGDVIENAAVVRGDLVRNSVPPSKALKGELRGDNFVVPLTQ